MNIFKRLLQSMRSASGTALSERLRLQEVQKIEWHPDDNASDTALSERLRLQEVQKIEWHPDDNRTIYTLEGILKKVAEATRNGMVLSCRDDVFPPFRTVLKPPGERKRYAPWIEEGVIKFGDDQYCLHIVVYWEPDI